MKNVLKKIVGTTTQVLKNVGDVIVKFNDDNFIGNAYLMLKRGTLKGFDSTFEKMENNNKFELRTLNLSLNQYKYKLDLNIIEDVEIRLNYTRLVASGVEIFVKTSYYLYFTNKIKNVELLATKATEPIAMYLKNEFIGLFLPCRLSKDEFEKDTTLEEYKKDLEIEELKKVKNEEFLQSLANEYIELHNKFLKEAEGLKDIVSYELEKVNKQAYQVVGITKDNQRQYYFKMTMLNCDVNLTEQKRIFKMIKDYLLSSAIELQQKEDKINDLSEVEENKNGEVDSMGILNTLEVNKDSQYYIDFIKNTLGYKTIRELKEDNKELYYNIRLHMVSYGSGMAWVDYASANGLNTREDAINHAKKQLSQLSDNIEVVTAQENKRYFKSTSPGHKDFKVIEGTTVITKELEGEKVWKINSPQDLIKDYKHKDQKAYVKHLKKFGYIEVYEDINNFVSWYNGNNMEDVIVENEKEVLAKYNNYTLCREGDFYFIDELDMVNIRGTKEEVIEELKRWSIEVDSNNKLMLEMENSFINVLENIEVLKDNKITISSDVEPYNIDCKSFKKDFNGNIPNMKLQLLANKELVNNINKSFISNSNKIKNNTILLN